MKFGQSFHFFQVPEWEPFYVSYGLLKKLFNSASENASGSRDESNSKKVYTCLSYNIDALNRFRNDTYDILRQKEVDVCKCYGLPLYISTILNLEEVDQYELRDLLVAFSELQKDLMKLKWYDRVNQHAIQRIYAKLEKHNMTGRHHHTHKSAWIKSQFEWSKKSLRDLERFDKLVADISQACLHAENNSKRTSLYIKNICDRQKSVLVYPTAAYHAIRNDHPSTLYVWLKQNLSRNKPPGSHLKALLYGLFEFSILCQSSRCGEVLLSEKIFNNGCAINHNYINHLIATIGRNNMLEDCDILNAHVRVRGVADEDGSTAGTNLLFQMFKKLGQSQKDVLRTNDALGRHPLHYSALYGLSKICQFLLDPFRKPGQSSTIVEEIILSADSRGYTPLHFAVIHNHVEITRLFLDTLHSDDQNSAEARNQSLESVLGDLLILALKYQYDEIVHLLVSSSVDMNHRSSRRETSLYVAAQTGREDYVKVLLDGAADQNVMDVPEAVYGWTPLFIACVAGHLAVVKILLQAGASHKILDHLGWTAKEHAVYKGYLEVAEVIGTSNTANLTGGPSRIPFKAAVGSGYHLQTGHSQIVVNLGVMQNGRKLVEVDLDCCSSEYNQNLHVDTRFSIELCVPGENAYNCLVQLPILEDMINEPFIFPIKDSIKPQLMFRIFCANSTDGAKGILVGSGTALLESYSHLFGAKGESLIREQTVPILERESLNCMGTVTFTYLIATPFKHLDIQPSITYSMEELNKIQIVGHRGLGQNIASREHLQLGENTIESFLSATKLGASCVEFDVQLTRDLVPIIYHDFSLSESGTDIPIYDLSLEQFMYASKIQSPQGHPPSVLGRATLQTTQTENNRGKPRSRSLTWDFESGAEGVQDRMKHTVDFMNKGFKPNTRGHSIQDSLATLEEVLVKLPQSISFDIEIKYPRLHEAVEAGVAPVGIELNAFVDVVLEKIYRLAGDRTIILSSFTPEVCILLSLKQHAYPVMFITNAGKPPLVDLETRASSLQVAVRFAKRWNLTGVVSACEILLLCPRLVKYVKASGLMCASYGLANSIPENAKLQVEAGLDIIMADRVGLISRTLQGAVSFQDSRSSES